MTSSTSDHINVICPTATIDDPEASRVFVIAFVMAKLKDIKLMLMVQQVDTLMIARHPTAPGFVVAMSMQYPILTEDLREHIRAYKTKECVAVTAFECYTSEQESFRHSELMSSVRRDPSIFYYNDDGVFHIGVDPRVTTYFEIPAAPPPPPLPPRWTNTTTFGGVPTSTYAEVLASRAFGTTRFP